MILMQVLPSFLLTCMSVMSATELSDAIADLLKSKSKHSPPDLNVAWLRCMKHLAKSACFSPTGNDSLSVLIYVSFVSISVGFFSLSVSFRYEYMWIFSCMSSLRASAMSRANYSFDLVYVSLYLHHMQWHVSPTRISAELCIMYRPNVFPMYLYHC